MSGMPRRSPLPSELMGGPFHVAAARATGVTPGRLRGSDLAKPFYAVRSVGEPLDLIERCRAYLPRMRPGNVFSHSTSATLWGMPLPQYLDTGSLHVTSPVSVRAPQGRGIIGHSQSISADVVRGLPVASPVETWVQLSTILPWWELVAVGEFVVTGLPFEDVLPLASVEALWEGHRMAGASRGARARERALKSVREGPFSRPESLSRVLFALGKLPEPLINQQVLDERGGFLALPDQIWPEFRVAFEYEGEHHREVARYRRDVRRVERLIDHEWRVVKATAEDLFDRPHELLARVARRLASGGWESRPRELRHFVPFRR